MRHLLILAIVCGFLGRSYGQALTGDNFPYRLTYQTDLPIAIGGSGLFAVPMIMGTQATPDSTYIHSWSIPEFEKSIIYNQDNVAKRVSDVLLYGMVGMAALSTGLNTNFRWKNWRVLMAMYAEALLWQQGGTYAFKNFIARPRPYTYHPDFDYSTAGDYEINSFLSGHSSTSFMSAVFMAKTYADIHPNSQAKVGVWVLSLTGATMCAGFRVASGSHFITDVLAGSAYGAIVGYLIPVLHKKPIKFKAKRFGGNINFMPVAGNNSFGVSMHLQFN